MQRDKITSSVHHVNPVDEHYFCVIRKIRKRGKWIMAAHEMKIRIMKTVSEGTREIILNRVRKKGLEERFSENSALAVLHGDVCEMIYASDLAQKAAGVEVFEIPGSCPQHMTCLGILGSVSAVEAAVQKIKKDIFEQ